MRSSWVKSWEKARVIVHGIGQWAGEQENDRGAVL
jgi:hypothetical protein